MSRGENLSSNAKYQARGGVKDGLRHRDLRDLLAKKIVRREMLYSDFITERARLLVDALEHNTSDPQKLIPAYALLSRIRLSSSSSVLAKAEEVIKTIMTTYPQPNLIAEQIQVSRGERRRPAETIQ